LSTTTNSSWTTLGLNPGLRSEGGEERTVITYECPATTQFELTYFMDHKTTKILQGKFKGKKY
jgi:hypothetical protein